MRGLCKFHPVLPCERAAEFEEEILGSDTGKIREAMTRVSEALAHQLLCDFNEFRPMPRDPRILVVAGKGHNGGDALLAGRLLLRSRPRGEAVIWPMVDPSGFSPLAREAFDSFVKEDHCTVLPVAEAAFDALGRQHFDICLDGILGMRFEPPMQGWMAAIVEFLNGMDIGFRAAVDLPSGLCKDTDAPVCRADFTYATGILKSPLLEHDALKWTGRLRYLDIGFFDDGMGGKDCPADWFAGRQVLTDAVLADLRKLRHPDCDKRSHGHLFVIAGSKEMPGAALLAVKAALRSGVGLVTAFVPETYAPAFAAEAPEAMWVPCEENEEGGLSLEAEVHIRKKLSRATALVIGPGIGTSLETRAVVEEVIRNTTIPVVLDADALQQALVSKIKGPYVLTPHVGEFARLSSSVPEVVSPERLWDYMKNFGLEGAVVLKGPNSWVASGDSLAMSPFGSSVLARAGSGDMLSGLIGGLLAKGFTAVDAARMGVVWHGQAGEYLARYMGHVAVSSSKLLNYLHEPLRL